MEHLKHLLIVAHAPSINTRKMVESLIKGATDYEASNINVTYLPPLDTTPEDILAADAVILGTTENLGYMSGALKDFFDRCYYPCLDTKQGLPCAAYIRAGHDGTGTCKALESITTGLRWRWVQPPMICRGEFQESFVDDCYELGMCMAAALSEGII